MALNRIFIYHAKRLVLLRYIHLVILQACKEYVLSSGDIKQQKRKEKKRGHNMQLNGRIFRNRKKPSDEKSAGL